MNNIAEKGNCIYLMSIQFAIITIFDVLLHVMSFVQIMNVAEYHKIREYECVCLRASARVRVVCVSNVVYLSKNTSWLQCLIYKLIANSRSTITPQQ